MIILLMHCAYLSIESVLGLTVTTNLYLLHPNCKCIVFLRFMFDKEKIAKLKKGVLIVNNARGAIMDTQAVVDACSSGHIAGM